MHVCFVHETSEQILTLARLQVVPLRSLTAGGCEGVTSVAVKLVTVQTRHDDAVKVHVARCAGDVGIVDYELRTRDI